MTVSSEARFIPKEKLTAWERWEMAALAETRAEQAQQEAVRKERAAQEAAEHSAAYAIGLEEGRKAGRAAGAAQARAEAERIARCADEAGAALAGLGGQLAEGTVALAIAIARRIVGEELSVRPEAVVGVVREAIAQLPEGTDRLVLNLHPEDAALVSQALAEDIARGQWRILEDARMSRGGCRLATAAGDVDASLESRWHHVLGSLGAMGTREAPRT